MRVRIVAQLFFFTLDFVNYTSLVWWNYFQEIVFLKAMILKLTERVDRMEKTVDIRIGKKYKALVFGCTCYCTVHSAYKPSAPIRASPGFWNMRRLGVLLFTLVGRLVHRKVTPSIKLAGTHLYTWMERGTVRVKFLSQEHNTMSPASAQTWTVRT